ncbi:MAG: aminotransferase class III-fold pyridoxal phosphate-dependent enzyme [Acidobacteriota bacterium]|nr:aminotransferase class III-fold pyridoxal phosphate-dependent enzyme [Acidobacteriota bacterium]
MDTRIPGAERYAFVSNRLALEVERTEGSYLITPDGRRILDAAGGAIVVNIGHGREEVAEVFARAARDESYVVPPFVTPSRARLTTRLLDRWLPDGLTRVVYTCGGSESADAAIRLARQHHVSAGRSSRYKVIGRDLSYHGITLGTLSIGGHGKRRTGFEPLLVSMPKAPACYCYRCPFDSTYPDCDVACASSLAEVIEREGPDTVAAFVAEPIGGSTAGALVPPDEYWPQIRDICAKYGVLVIADEVMTGFGRTGRKFGVDHWDVVPDVMFGGKGLSGGYAPMGALFATEEVVAPIIAAGDELMFYTYSGFSAGCAVADKVLEIVERENLVERAATMGGKLRQRLLRFESHPNVAEVRGIGLLMALELVADRDTGASFPKSAGLANAVVSAGIAEGAFFYPSGTDPARDIVTLGPPFTVSESELDDLAAILEKSIDTAVGRIAA